MTTTVETAGGQTLTPLSAAVDSLLVADLGRLSRDELLDALRGLECESRRLAAVGHRVVAEVAARNVAGELRYRDTASLLGQPLPAVLGSSPVRRSRLAASSSASCRRWPGLRRSGPQPSSGRFRASGSRMVSHSA